jgi:rubredoxin
MANTGWDYPGATATGTPSGGTTAWTSTGNITNNDAVYARATGPGTGSADTQTLRGRTHGFALASGSTIDGLNFRYERVYVSGSACVEVDERVINESAAYEGTDSSNGGSWTTSVNLATYGGSTNMLGTTMTEANVENSNFGWGVRANTTGTGGKIPVPTNADVDYFQTRVYYTAPLPAPTIGTPSVIDYNSVTVNWTDNSSGETGFRRERTLNGGGWSLVTTAGANTSSYTWNSATEDSQYTFRVRANGSPNSAWSGTSSAANTPPRTSVIGTATVTDYNSVTANWTCPSTSETGFRIQYTLNGGGWTTLTTTGVNTTTYAWNSATEDSQYTFRVRTNGTYANAVNSSASNTVTTPPRTAVIGTATVTDFNSVTCNWTCPSVSETGFRVEYRANGGAWTLLTTTAANVTTYAWNSATEDTDYEFRVRTNGTYSNAVWSGTSNLVTTPPQTAVIGTATVTDFNSVTANWTCPSTSETGFRVEYRANGGAWTLLTTTAANVTTYAWNSATEDTDYEFRVRTNGDNANAVFSATSNLVSTPPQTAVIGTATVTDYNSVVVNWTCPSTSETGFAVEYRANGGSWTALVTAGINDTSYNWDTATEDTDYEFQVRTNGDNANAAFSATSNLISTPCQDPTDCTIDLFTPPNSVDISWSDISASEANYQIERQVDGGGWSILSSTIPANTTTYEDTAPSLPGTHEYRVKALGDNADSGYSTSTGVYLSNPAPVDANFKAKKEVTS